MIKASYSLDIALFQILFCLLFIKFSLIANKYLFFFLKKNSFCLIFSLRAIEYFLIKNKNLNTINDIMNWSISLIISDTFI